MYNISVLDKVKKPGIVAIDCPEGRFQHRLDYQEASSPRSDRSLVLDLASPLYYPSSKSKVYDRSPYRNIGTIFGAIHKRLWTGHWVLELDGDDDYVDCGDIDATDGIAGLTIIVWSNPTVLVNNAGIVTKSQDADCRWGIDARADGKIYFLMTALINAGGFTAAGKEVVGTWANIALVFNGGGTANADKLKGYVNGSNEALTYFGTIPALTASTANTVRIGDEEINAHYNGYVGISRIHSRALSAAENRNHDQQEKHLFGA